MNKHNVLKSNFLVLRQLPSKLKAPTAEEQEAAQLSRSLSVALENNTALAEAVSGKDDLVKELNSRIKQVRAFVGRDAKYSLCSAALNIPK